jgi:hypothetical protein
MNKTDLYDKLDHYRKERQLTADIAMQGYLHAMKYHRAVNLADYVFKVSFVWSMIMAFAA